MKGSVHKPPEVLMFHAIHSTNIYEWILWPSDEADWPVKDQGILWDYEKL